MAKKEHSAKKDTRFFNSFTFKWVDTHWVCVELDKQPDSVMWDVQMIVTDIKHFAQLEDQYGSFTRWDIKPILDGISSSIGYYDVFFLRYWLDRYVRHTSDEIWNFVWDKVRHNTDTPGRTDDRSGEIAAAKQVEAWQALWV